MKLELYKQQLMQTVIEPIREFKAEAEIDDFTDEDIEQCSVLLDSYLEALAAMDSPTDEAIMEQVEKLILALNDLNEQTDYAMIETGEREAICALVQESAIAFGLQEYGDDITEDWREW